MTEFTIKQTLNDYDKEEFEAFVTAISKNRAASEAEGDAWLEHFISVVPHPAKSDLIYWPETDADDSPSGVVNEIERYCLDNGLPAFKDSPRGRA